MEDLLIAILQGLFEFALEVLANIPFDWPLSTRRTSDHIPAYGRDIVACLGITDSSLHLVVRRSPRIPRYGYRNTGWMRSRRRPTRATAVSVAEKVQRT